VYISILVLVVNLNAILWYNVNQVFIHLFVGWDSDMSAILLLLHLLPPSAQGRKRPGKLSAYQAVDQLIRFQKVCLND